MIDIYQRRTQNNIIGPHQAVLSVLVVCKSNYAWDYEKNHDQSAYDSYNTSKITFETHFSIETQPNWLAELIYTLYAFFEFLHLLILI